MIEFNYPEPVYYKDVGRWVIGPYKPGNLALWADSRDACIAEWFFLHYEHDVRVTNFRRKKAARHWYVRRSTKASKLKDSWNEIGWWNTP